MLDAAQRQNGTVGERRRRRQPAQTGGDPTAMLLRKRLRLAHTAARRHGEDDLPRAGMNAQRVTAGAAVAPHVDQENLLVEDDLKRLWRTLPTVEQSTQRLHGRLVVDPANPGGRTVAAGHARHQTWLARIWTRNLAD